MGGSRKGTRIMNILYNMRGTKLGSSGDHQLSPSILHDTSIFIVHGSGNVLGRDFIHVFFSDESVEVEGGKFYGRLNFFL